MSRPLLIDSTLWIDWLRQRIDPLPRLRAHLESNMLMTCGQIRMEVLRGIIHPGQRERMMMLFESFTEIPTVAHIWKMTADLAWKLDRQGHVLPSSDILIAAHALYTNSTVVTHDSHFDHIPGLQLLNQLP